MRKSLADELSALEPADRQREVLHRCEDYRTWLLMGEAPAHVQELAASVDQAMPGSTEPTELCQELLAMLESLYGELDVDGNT